MTTYKYIEVCNEQYVQNVNRRFKVGDLPTNLTDFFSVWIIYNNVQINLSGTLRL